MLSWCNCFYCHLCDLLSLVKNELKPEPQILFIPKCCCIEALGSQVVQQNIYTTAICVWDSFAFFYYNAKDGFTFMPLSIIVSLGNHGHLSAHVCGRRQIAFHWVWSVWSCDAALAAVKKKQKTVCWLASCVAEEACICITYCTPSLVAVTREESGNWPVLLLSRVNNKNKHLSL